MVKALFSAFFVASYGTKNRQKLPENAPKPLQKVAMPLVDMIYFRLREILRVLLMATKRFRNNAWAYVIRRKNLLPKPVYLTFSDEAEGDAYVAHLEQLLDHGVVPAEFQVSASTITTIREMVIEYTVAVDISSDDKQLLNVLVEREGHTLLSTLDYTWCENWVRSMKRGRNLSPGTIRHYVGALARCLDWGARKEHIVANPLRLLPKRYASYTDADAAVAKKRIDQSRDRRISAEEEQRVRAILGGEKPEGRQRALTLMHQEALICLFELAIETAMRLREMYTLSYSQVSIKDRTIYLDKTKNGDKRQVPLSSVALVALKSYDLRKKRGLLFPWWNGDANSEVLKKTTGRLSRQFARIFDAAGCQDMRFHDLRHEATSRLYERTDLSDLEIAKITGHKDPKMLMRYANLRGSNLAGRLW